MNRKYLYHGLTLFLTVVCVSGAQTIERMRTPAGDHVRAPFAIHVEPFGPAGPSGLTPPQIKAFYGFNKVANGGAGQMIAIVDPYDDPKIEGDLAVFDSQYGLPACTTVNGCFTKIGVAGTSPSPVLPPPASDTSWDVEIALDVEWAHAIAPQAKIVLVEATSDSVPDMLDAVVASVYYGANVVSMSWGAGESPYETQDDWIFQSPTGTVTYVAASGDNGDGVGYPSTSPWVVGVGGTTITTNSSGSYLQEVAWSKSGGGLSAFEFEPFAQTNYRIPDDPAMFRGVPDVAYSADPSTGFSVYDSIAYTGPSGNTLQYWMNVGGTSAGTPQWAALFAIVNSERAAARKGPIATAARQMSGTVREIYAAAKSSSQNFHDITSGSNGTCGVLCDALKGYDYVTGLGTPVANNLIAWLVKQ